MILYTCISILSSKIRLLVSLHLSEIYIHTNVLGAGMTYGFTICFMST